MQGSDGNFYGTTGIRCGVNEVGTVFKMTPSGILTTLYSFDGLGDGGYPWAGLVQGNDSNFYGTTEQGGVNGPDPGTVFKITPSGTLTTLHSFFFIDGWHPLAGLVQGSDGNFYGTTVDGGQYEFGNVFKITPSGTLTFSTASPVVMAPNLDAS